MTDYTKCDPIYPFVCKDKEFIKENFLRFGIKNFVDFFDDKLVQKAFEEFKRNSPFTHWFVCWDNNFYVLRDFLRVYALLYPNETTQPNSLKLIKQRCK